MGQDGITQDKQTLVETDGLNLNPRLLLAI